jgi:hypothetical protein
MGKVKNNPVRAKNWMDSLKVPQFVRLSRIFARWEGASIPRDIQMATEETYLCESARIWFCVLLLFVARAL